MLRVTFLLLQFDSTLTDVCNSVEKTKTQKPWKWFAVLSHSCAISFNLFMHALLNVTLSPSFTYWFSLLPFSCPRLRDFINTHL